MVADKGAQSRGFIENYLPYMLNTLVHNMLRGVETRFEEYGLTVTTWRILAVLAENPSCGFARLAKLTDTQPATLSRLIGTMIKSKLVRQRRSRSDARTVSINITAEGREVLERTMPWAVGAEERLVDGVAEAEIEVLKRILRVCSSNLEKDRD